MINQRQSFRLRKQFDVAWSIPEQKIEGQGKILNISLSGMLFITDKLFSPEDGLIINFKIDQAPAFPPKGRLAWFRKLEGDRAQYQCGVRFFSEASSSPAWNQWMEDNILKLANTEDSRILERYLSQGQE